MLKLILCHFFGAKGRHILVRQDACQRLAQANRETTLSTLRWVYLSMRPASYLSGGRATARRLAIDAQIDAQTAPVDMPLSALKLAGKLG